MHTKNISINNQEEGLVIYNNQNIHCSSDNRAPLDKQNNYQQQLLQKEVSKQCRIKHKVLMLMHVTSRLAHQHQTLLTLNNGQQKSKIVQKIISFAHNCETANERVNSIKQRLNFWRIEHQQKELRKDCSAKIKNRKIFELRSEIQKLRALVQLRKKALTVPVNQVSGIHQSAKSRLSQISKSANEVLTHNILQTSNAKKQNMLNSMGLTIKKTSISHLGNLQTDMGILMCQLFYLQSIKNNNLVSKQTKQEYNQAQIKKQTAQNLQSQLQNRIIQTQIMEKEFLSFSQQAMERLQFNSMVVGDKLDSLQKCMLAKQRNRQVHNQCICYSKTPISNKKHSLGSIATSQQKSLKDSNKLYKMDELGVSCVSGSKQSNFMCKIADNSMSVNNGDKIKAMSGIIKRLQYQKKGIALSKILMVNKHYLLHNLIDEQSDGYKLMCEAMRLQKVVSDRLHEIASDQQQTVVRIAKLNRQLKKFGKQNVEVSNQK